MEIKVEYRNIQEWKRRKIYKKYINTKTLQDKKSRSKRRKNENEMVYEHLSQSLIVEDWKYNLET